MAGAVHVPCHEPRARRTHARDQGDRRAGQATTQTLHVTVAKPAVAAAAAAVGTAAVTAPATAATTSTAAAARAAARACCSAWASSARRSCAASAASRNSTRVPRVRLQPRGPRLLEVARLGLRVSWVLVLAWTAPAAAQPHPTLDDFYERTRARDDGFDHCLGMCSQHWLAAFLIGAQTANPSADELEPRLATGARLGVDSSACAAVMRMSRAPGSGPTCCG